MPRGRSKRGGYQAPNKPAAVSGPGKLSRRTDSATTQPIRAARQDLHGQRGQLEDAQRAAPLPAGGGGGGAGMAPVAPPPMGDVFADPSALPDEALTAGAMLGDGPGPSNIIEPSPMEALLVLAERSPYPDVLRIIERYVLND